MRFSPSGKLPLRRPKLLDKAHVLAEYLKTLSPKDLEKTMKISPALAKKTQLLVAEWTMEEAFQSLAIDSFIGDIYSGLQALNLSDSDREYADKVLYILSGLYGILRPYDGICPYRLEMGYKLPSAKFSNLYRYWGDSLATCLPKEGLIVNLTSGEYGEAILPFINEKRVVSPQFLTVNSKTKEPGFVAVHAKIARGTFARWLIKNRIEEAKSLTGFKELGYYFDPELSTKNTPTFVCRTFEGKGLSIK